MILKSDADGRMLLPVEQQVELVRGFERSGLSGPRFAAMAGLKFQTFTAWRRIGHHPACAGSWVSGGKPIRPRRHHTPSPHHAQGQLDPPPQKQFPSIQRLHPRAST